MFILAVTQDKILILLDSETPISSSSIPET